MDIFPAPPSKPAFPPAYTGAKKRSTKAWRVWAGDHPEDAKVFNEAMTAYYAERKAWWKEVCDLIQIDVETTCCYECGESFTFDEPVPYIDYMRGDHDKTCAECLAKEEEEDEDEDKEEKDEDEEDEEAEEAKDKGRCSHCNDGIDGFDGGMYNKKLMCAGCITELCDEAAHEDAVLKASSGQ
jgi:hypothetical protein